MGKKSILFFGDSSQVMGSFLDAILKGQQQAHGPLLSSFLEQSCLVLQEEWGMLQSTQRAALPNFRSLACLSHANTPHDEDRHPALQLIELVLVQLAYFINAYEQSPEEPYPARDRSICVGVCFGELSAAVVALSASLHDLIPLAVDAVRLSFRGGVLAATVGNDIEGRDASGGTWALSIPRDTGLDSSENLAALHGRLNIPTHKYAWISALGNTTLTLAGPPSSLDLISEHLVSRNDFTKVSSLRRLPIRAPYHAENLFSKAETNNIIRQTNFLNCLKFPRRICHEQQKAIIGGSAQHLTDSSIAHQVLEDVMYEIFAKPIDWNAITFSCKEILGQDLTTSYQVRTFGPDLQGRYLVSQLEKMGFTGLAFNADFSKVIEEAISSPSTPIAIIGMAGRFPSANNPDEFWSMLSRGVDCVQEVPDDRFDKSVHFKDPIWGCFMENPGLFDPRFFHMSPREAVNTDPAHRLGLTTVQEALDMAGVVSNKTASTDASRIGTFWGNATEEYKEEYMSQHVDPYYIPGSSRAFAPGRVNFIYNFDGPAVSFDTACSSSMIALNHACNWVSKGDCGTAIVVGSNILTAPYSYKGLDLGHFLSKTGGCKSFDEYADGYCRGEAVATVIIKKLKDAIADNDNVLGVIRSISTNHSSGASSITRPHGPTQEKLFHRLLQQANLKPSDISYVEMHGTGTQAGDTVEMTSVANVLAPESSRRESPLFIGAVKSSVGHGEGASGITSLVKCLLMLREQKIPPHVGIKSGIRRSEPDLGSRNIHIASSIIDWEPSATEKSLRRVLISNFSAAGGNTAMILEEASPQQTTNSNDRRSHQIISVSGKTRKSLQDNTKKLLEWTKQQPSLSMSDLSYSVTVRRPHYEFRYSFAVSNQRDMEQQMDSKLGISSNQDSQPAKTAIVFTGYTNTQSPAMRELFNSSSFFRSEILRLDRSVQRLGYETIISFFSSGDKHELSFIQRQLGYVVSQIAMYRLVISWGVRPSAVTGHSLGEYVALCASGMIVPDDLIYIIGLRAKALEEKCNLESHGMLAVRTSVADAQEYLQSNAVDLEISCINSPSDIVLSGSISDLEKAKELLSGKQIHCQRVDTPLAFHSSQMDVVGDDLLAAQKCIKISNPHTPLLSATERTLVESASQLAPDYLKRHTRGTVDFCALLSKGLPENSELDQSMWLELGPHGICSSMIKANLGPKTPAVPLMKRDEGFWATAPRAVSLLYNAGHNIDWNEYHREYQSQQLLLNIPSYVLDEQKYWLPQKKPAELAMIEKTVMVEQPPASRMNVAISSKSVHTLVSRSVHDGFSMLSFETNLLEPHLYEIMQGHMMNGSYLCPASLYTDIALTIGEYLRENVFEVQHNFRACISTLEIHKAIIAPRFNSGASLILRIVAHSDLFDNRTKLRFETKSPDNDEMQVHAQCQVNFEKKQDWIAEWTTEQSQVLQDMGNLEAKLFRGLSQKLLQDLVYRLFDNVVVYGDKFRSLKEVLVDETQLQALASVELYQGSDSNGYVCCPYWMDGLVHLAGFLINGLRPGSERAVYISPGWANFRLPERIDPRGRYMSYVRLEDHGSTVTAECFILSGEQIIGKVDGLKFQLLPRSIINKVLPPGGHEPQIKQHQDLVLSTSESVSSSDPTQTDDSSPPPSREDTAPIVSLTAIISEETGVAVDDIFNEIDLMDLGIDSLLALTITDRLREEFHITFLPADLFQTHATFGELESYIQSVTLKSSHRQNDTRTKKTTGLPSDEPSMPKLDSNSADSEVKDLSTAREQLRKVIAEQMGLEVAKLSPSDDLFDLGLDSLMSLEIAEALRSDLGFNLDQNFFAEASTLEDIENALFKSSPSPVHVVDEEAALARTTSQRLSICLQGDANKCAKKLFLFPDGSGAASVYARLPTIDEKICVYGFNSPYLKKGIISLSVADMVSLWVREIRNCQPQGPYHLGGYSSGGYYAYEAAKILIEDRQSVETLICIDTPSRSSYDALPEDILGLVANSAVLGEGEGTTPAWLLDHFRSSIRAITSYIPTPMLLSGQPKTYLIWAASGIDDLRSTIVLNNRFSNGISKFFAGKRGPIRPHGWAELIARQNIRMANVSGNHFNVMHLPNAQNLRDLLAAAMLGKEDYFQTLPGTNLGLSASPQWQPHCASFTMDQLHNYMSRKAPTSEISLKHQLNTLVLLYIRQILENVSEVESRQLAPHFQRYYQWMRYEMGLKHPDELPDEDIKSLEVDVASSGVDGALLCRVGRNIFPIIRGQTQPLHLMLQDKLLFEYYPNNIHTSPCYPQVEMLVRRQLTTSKPLKILEIGAGTGATTKAVFRVISEFEKSEGSDPGFGHYTYTDISAGFFKQAKDTFKSHVSRMTFKKLDIEEGPSAQGFKLGQYDLIIASQCLHATKNMTETMTHVRQLLKPGGKLIMVEGTRDALDISFIFGVLPGWWLGVEETRKLTPCLNLEQWIEVLRRVGFNGADLVVPNCDSEIDHSLSVIMSTAVELY